MMWAAFEIGINLLEAYFMLFFMKHRLHMKCRFTVQEISCLIGITAFLSMYYFVDVGIPDTLVFLIPLLFGLISAKDPWYVCAFWASVLALMFITCISVTYHLLLSIPGITYQILIGETPERLALVMISNVVVIILICLIIS